MGFFLADWSAAGPAVQRSAPGAPLTLAPLTRTVGCMCRLPDETRAAVIQWACAEGACLIEAHSHGRWSPAAFSDYDLRNLREWVTPPAMAPSASAVRGDRHL